MIRVLALNFMIEVDQVSYPQNNNSNFRTGVVPNIADDSALPGSIPIEGRCAPTQVLFSINGVDRCIGSADLLKLKNRVASVKKER